MPNRFVETSLPKLTEIYTTVVLLECAYYPGAKSGKKYALNKQYALLSQLHVLTRAYSIVNAET